MSTDIRIRQLRYKASNGATQQSRQAAQQELADILRKRSQQNRGTSR